MYGNWEIPRSPWADGAQGRIGKAKGHTTMMNERGKSDRPVVPRKSPNKAGHPAAEGMEERGLAERNVDQQDEPRTQNRIKGSLSALERVREVARKNKDLRFTTLLHHVSIDRLRNCFKALNPKAAPGVDGVMWELYAQDLEANLEDLHARVHRGGYRAKPSRRVYIPKADGKLRPLGIASLEDKILQRAVVEVLNAIYEEDFLGFSYGFRPKRSQHQALDALATGILRKKVNFVLDADIRGFFDAIDRGWMVKFLEHRIADKRLLRLIQKWLNAGVMEAGKRIECEDGVPQGASVSPLLANVYLHYVFDLWAQQWRTRHASGDVVIVRFADDFIVGFQHQGVAQKFLRDLKERLTQFGLELHPEKTRLIEFGRFAAQDREARGEEKPETFNFLGFTHISGKTPQGKFTLLRQTIRTRLRTKLSKIKVELRERMHDSIPKQGAWLRSVLNGYFAYHAVPTNTFATRSFRTQVAKLWLQSLRRRSQRDRTTWNDMKPRIKRWLPSARVRHPWPTERFYVRTRGKSPVR